MNALKPVTLARLRKFSELFDIHVHERADGRYDFEVLESDGLHKFSVPKEHFHARLLSEFCSKTARWVCYRPGIHCEDTFTALSDKKIQRTSELYARWKSKGYPA